jgi:hypothetical protein
MPPTVYSAAVAATRTLDRDGVARCRGQPGGERRAEDDLPAREPLRRHLAAAVDHLERESPLGREGLREDDHEAPVHARGGEAKAVHLRDPLDRGDLVAE